MIVLMLLALGITIWIGNSNQNKHSNKDYDKNQGAKLLKLSIYYIAATVIGIIVFLIYLYYR